MINQKKITVLAKIRIKTPMLRSDLFNFSDSYIVVKGDITVTAPYNAKRNKSLHFKIIHYLSTVFQKLMVYKLIVQKI